MADLNDLLIRIDATTEQLRREMKRAESAVDQTTKKIDKDLGKVDMKFAALAKGAALAGAAIAAAAAAAGGAKLVAVARETDILDAQLKTATGSAEGAAKAFANLEKFAAETPYSLQEVTRAFVKLKNYGLDPSEAALISYGNTAAAMGKTLDQMIEAVADASNKSFERLREFGVTAKQNGNEVALTFRGLTTTIGNNAAEIEQYLRRIGDVDFAGAMMDRANSLDGALSNLGDSWDALFRTISRGPIGQAIEDQVRQASESLGWLSDRIKQMQGTGTADDEIRWAIERLKARREELIPRIVSPERSTTGQIVAENARKQVLAINEEIEGLLAVQENLIGAARRRETIAEIVVRSQRITLPRGVARTTDDRPDADPMIEAPKERQFDGGAAALERESQRIQEAFGEVDAFFQGTRNETEQLQAQILRVQELAAQGFFAAKGIDDQQILERLNAQMADIDNKTEQLSEFGLEAARAMQQAFADFLFDPFSDGLDGMLEGFLKTIQRMMAEIAAQQVLTNLFGSFAGSTNPILAGLASFGGARANGGPVAAGKNYLVGERGPEMFQSSVGGRISQLGGGVKVDIIDQRGAGAPPVEVTRNKSNGMEQIRMLIRGEVSGMFADGSMDRQFSAASMPIRRTGRR